MIDKTNSIQIITQNSGSNQNFNSQNSQNISKEKNLHNLLVFSEPKSLDEHLIDPKQRTKTENWDHNEIKKIFTLYAQYGSQWKIIQTQFTDRSSNSIKNRFYTVVRTFLKILFRQHPSIENKLPHQIPSKIILKFFQGRQQFIKFKGFGKKILKNIDYDLQSKKLKKIVEDNESQIKVLYDLIFPLKEKNNSQKVKSKILKTQKQMMLGQYLNEGQLQSDSKKALNKEAISQITCPSQQKVNDIHGVPVFNSENQKYTSNIIFVPTTNYYSILGYQFLPFY